MQRRGVEGDGGKILWLPGTTYIPAMGMAVLSGSSHSLHSAHQCCWLSCISSLFSLKAIRTPFCPNTDAFRAFCRPLIAPWQRGQSHNTKFWPTKLSRIPIHTSMQTHPVKTIITLHSHGHSLSERAGFIPGFMLLSLYCPTSINRI